MHMLKQASGSLADGNAALSSALLQAEQVRL